MRLVACPECDALQNLPQAESRVALACWRCDAILERGEPPDLGNMLALLVTALILYIFTNAYPLLILQGTGGSTQTTLIGAAAALWGAGLIPISLLVYATTIIGPALELALLFYVVGGLQAYVTGRYPRVPIHTARALRVLHAIRPWTMLEVCLLGALISYVRLTHIVDVEVGFALWTFAGLVISFAMITARLEPHTIWQRLETLGLIEAPA